MDTRPTFHHPRHIKFVQELRNLRSRGSAALVFICFVEYSNFERDNTSLRIIERRRLTLGDKGLFALDLRHAPIDGEIHAGDI